MSTSSTCPIDVYPFDLYHVVAASDYAVDSRETGAAGTFFGYDAGKIVSPVSYERRAFLFQRGYDYLADLPVGNVFSGLRIDYLKIDEIVPIVHRTPAQQFMPMPGPYISVSP